MDTELLRAALLGLEHQRTNIEQKITEVRNMLGDGAGSNATPSPPKKKRISAAGRKRIAVAQRKRWAAFRKASQPASAKRSVVKKLAR